MENERDLKEIPDNIKADLQIKPVKWIDEVLQIALQYMPTPTVDTKSENLVKPAKRARDKSKKSINTH
ncbi:MAG: S16 family serine protease, partial [Pseudomonadota bacterium]|nr:S16 family serine protease [Pseudomonadota bacterium]